MTNFVIRFKTYSPWSSEIGVQFQQIILRRFFNNHLEAIDVIYIIKSKHIITYIKKNLSLFLEMYWRNCWLTGLMDRKPPHVGLEYSDLLIMLVLEPETNTGSNQPHPYLQLFQKNFKEYQIILLKSQRTHGRRCTNLCIVGRTQIWFNFAVWNFQENHQIFRHSHKVLGLPVSFPPDVTV